MARGRREIEPCSKTYGFPIYCAGWVPFSHIPTSSASQENENENEGDDKGDSAASDASDKFLVALGGGGGEGRSGVPNALVISGFDFPSRSLSDEPVIRIGTESDLPYRMAIHPTGDGIICSFPNGSRWFKWDLRGSRDYKKLALNPSEESLTQLENVSLQALCFNKEGSVLATGSEDGNLRVFKWPAMESILSEVVDDNSIKDLDFSFDGKHLASLRSSGPCRVWDLNSSSVIANLARESGEIFRFCRFSCSSDDNQVLFVIAMHDDQGKIITWNTTTWKRIGSKRVVKDPISAFNISPDGKLLAVGTIEGGIVVLNSKNLQVHSVIKKAHLGLLTYLVFSQDSRLSSIYFYNHCLLVLFSFFFKGTCFEIDQISLIWRVQVMTLLVFTKLVQLGICL
ncbi:SEC12-like protein 2 [Rhynchospora pubera]|uniref:SEC12-like protein 2 n=1 Tax=Rhynchospora pubera TaxID=906938 RepID=A0AAV8DJQ5_9POAL|nr:SEC12-like protein 2 [Rhynchospora pubera]